MSRWLNQVNNLLERLDGQVEAVAADDAVVAPSTALLQSVTSRAAGGLSNLVSQAVAVSAPRSRRRRTNPSGDTGELTSSDDDYSDDDYEDDEDEDQDEEYAGESNDGDDEYDTQLEDEQADSDPSPVKTPVDTIATTAARSVHVEMERVDDDDDYVGAQTQTHEVGTPSSDSMPGSTQPLFLNERVSTNDPIMMVAKETTEEVVEEPDETSGTIRTPGAPSKVPSFPTPQINNQSSRKQPVTTAPPPASGNTKALTLQMQQLKKLHFDELAQLVAQHEASLQVMAQNESELATLRRQNTQYQTEMSALRRELGAVNDELQQAAVTVEQERAAAKEERDELLYEQEDELQQLKKDYEAQLQRLRSDLQQQRTQFQSQLTETKRERVKLDGDLTAELQQAQEREDAANQSIQTMEERTLQLQEQVDETQEKLATTIQQLNEAKERLQTAEAVASTAEERLDTLIDQHKSQLQQRLVREAALEQTVAELSRAAAVASSAGSVDTHAQKAVVDERDRLAAQVVDYKDRLQLLQEEADTRQSELTSSHERSHALQRELTELTQERQIETAALQTEQRELEARLHTLTQTYQRVLEQTGGRENSMLNSQGSNHTDHLTRELDLSKQQVASLSDQLRRQQGASETFKSEMLALKVRLQAATARAETAERQQEMFSEVELGQTSNSSLMDSGSRNHRRRVKGGRAAARMGPLSTRTMRGAVGWHKNMASSRGSGDWKQQLGDTMDALDHWMLETGGILRHEPLARLGFAAYLVMIHLWCFGLVMFHTIEAEHGDLGYLTDRNRLGNSPHT